MFLKRSCGLAAFPSSEGNFRHARDFRADLLEGFRQVGPLEMGEQGIEMHPLPREDLADADELLEFRMRVIADGEESMMTRCSGLTTGSSWSPNSGNHRRAWKTVLEGSASPKTKSNRTWSRLRR
ncbi:MAG: hypothetical protein GX442_01270 [Candidatus Riflebacteria bacterium]|nr:hypothetical protein [Candidatus Riflebacteria bacterium]